MTDTEIRILKIGLDFVQIQNKENEPELSSDFEEFCLRIELNGISGISPFQNLGKLLLFYPNLSRNHLWVNLMLECS